MDASAQAVVSGWGVTEQGTTSQNLRATTVPLRADSVCRSVYGSSTFASARFVCAGGSGAQSSSNNADSCSGDSGGPLVLSTGSGYAPDRPGQLRAGRRLWTGRASPPPTPRCPTPA